MYIPPKLIVPNFRKELLMKWINSYTNEILYGYLDEYKRLSKKSGINSTSFSIAFYKFLVNSDKSYDLHITSMYYYMDTYLCILYSSMSEYYSLCKNVGIKDFESNYKYVINNARENCLFYSDPSTNIVVCNILADLKCLRNSIEHSNKLTEDDRMYTIVRMYTEFIYLINRYSAGIMKMLKFDKKEDTVETFHIFT